MNHLLYILPLLLLPLCGQRRWALACCVLMLAAPVAAQASAGSNDWEPLSKHLGETDERAATGQSFAIRLPMLPSRAVQAAPAQRVSESRVDVWKKAQMAAAAARAAEAPQQATAQPAAQQAPQSKPAQPAPAKEAKASPDSCDTVSDMRKRRLAALESDRKTLAELRQALHDMKLTQRLSFLVDQASPNDGVDKIDRKSVAH